MKRLLPLVVLLAAIAGGCSSSHETEDGTTTTTSKFKCVGRQINDPACETDTIPSPTTTADLPAQVPMTADAFLAALTAAGLPVGPTVTYTEETDPNDNLGRPGQYTAKVAWVDSRVDCPGGEPDTTCGGTAEFFTEDDDRDKRYDYLGGFADSPPIGGYYMWRMPGAVVRVGYELTPTQAEEYAAALEAMAPGEVEQFEP